MCLHKYPGPVSLVVLVINPWPKTHNPLTNEDETFESQRCLKVVSDIFNLFSKMVTHADKTAHRSDINA